MVTENQKTIHFWKLAVLASAVCIVNCFFYSSRTIMYVVVGAEVFWLLFLLVRGQLLQYYGQYVMFMALSLEFPQFVGTDAFYGFKSIGIGPINIGVLMIFPLLFRLLFTKKITFQKHSSFDGFFFGYTALVGVAFVLGLLHWGLNDNNIGKFATVGTFISYLYINAYIYICFLALFLLSKRRDFDTEYIQNILFAIIFAVGITMVMSWAFSNYGVYGGIRTLQICSLYLVLPCCVLVFIYKNINAGRRIPVFVAAVVISLLSLIFNASGKLILSIGVSVIFILIVLLRKNKSLLIVAILALPVAAVLGLKGVSALGNQSLLLSIKIEQALSMVAFWRADWFENLSLSPKFRIYEFLTIGSEFLHKPWDLFLGKGYMGSTLDNLGYFAQATETTFSQFELTNHVYISMHETFNFIFLTNGLYGLYFYIKYLLKGLRIAHISLWGVIGTYWLGLFFNYSITIAAFGITAFSLALIMSDRGKL